MAKPTYYELLRSPHWQKRRLQILERAEFRCESCFDGESTLNVHHRMYVKGNKPWEYADHLLVALCESCHKHWHYEQDLLKEMILNIPTGMGNMGNELGILAGVLWAGFHRPRGWEKDFYLDIAKEVGEEFGEVMFDAGVTAMDAVIQARLKNLRSGQ